MEEQPNKIFEIGDKAQVPKGNTGIVREQYFDIYRSKWKVSVEFEHLKAQGISPVWFDEVDLIKA